MHLKNVTGTLLLCVPPLCEWGKCALITSTLGKKQNRTVRASRGLVFYFDPAVAVVAPPADEQRQATYRRKEVHHVKVVADRKQDRFIAQDSIMNKTV